uniref:Uncharacterized protein n=1 Tax=Strombidinopsis acuminata TaxID=141414 RepID=A0A7S3TU05_9SPIT|mmetsp:Transcript_14280/g.43886  ORF Transcript_14280/g.43886 Transcript_14280/m.43886 type:complete len:187 (-) Transcript_14280:190-750(-)
MVALAHAICGALSLVLPPHSPAHVGRRVQLVRMDAPAAPSEDSTDLSPEEKDLTWFYGGVDDQKLYSDYIWDPEHPGSFKPGLTRENYNLDDVREMWKDKPNENVMRFPIDEFIHLPLKPPEGILEWLDRKGLLSDDEDESGDDLSQEDAGMLDEEFDLEGGDEEAITDASLLDPKDLGATMSDFM